MKVVLKVILMMVVIAGTSSCVSSKKFKNLQEQYGAMQNDLDRCQEAESVYAKRLDACQRDSDILKTSLASANTSLELRQEQLDDMRAQLADMKQLRDKQVSQVGDLTVLSQKANENLSDKMLYQAGSSNLTPKSKEVLGKIAKIIESRPNLEVMVEGYTDTDPIRNSCIQDNWDLSVKRATSVVRVLQKEYGVDPNKLIAAGRGEYNALAPNDTAANKAINRRTRIIILPKLGEFYDLLNPDMAPK